MDNINTKFTTCVFMKVFTPTEELVKVERAISKSIIREEGTDYFHVTTKNTIIIKHLTSMYNGIKSGDPFRVKTYLGLIESNQLLANFANENCYVEINDIKHILQIKSIEKLENGYVKIIFTLVGFRLKFK